MLIFRAPESDDFALVADSFWRGVRECPSVFGLRREFVVKLLADVIIRADWQVEILCDDNAPEEILCWCVHQGPFRIFWISVKPRYMGLGFARKMLDHIGVVPGIAVSGPIIPPALVARAGKHGIRLVQRPYMSMV